jgi:hypothetical protein
MPANTAGANEVEVECSLTVSDLGAASGDVTVLVGAGAVDGRKVRRSSSIHVMKAWPEMCRMAPLYDVQVQVRGQSSCCSAQCQLPGLAWGATTTGVPCPRCRADDVERHGGQAVLRADGRVRGAGAGGGEHSRCAELLTLCFDPPCRGWWSQTRAARQPAHRLPLHFYHPLQVLFAVFVLQIDFGAHFFGEVIERKVTIFNNGPVEAKYMLR